MKTITFKLTLFCALLIFAGSCSQNRHIIINAADFGLSENSDATPAIREALKACKNISATKLILPKGEYHFYPQKAYEQYIAVSNNSNGKKRVAFPIIDMHDFEIDGQGSKLIFHGQISPFIVHQSSTINLRNFSIDWDSPFHNEASVVAVDEENQTFDIRISKDYKYAIEGHELVFYGVAGKQNIAPNIWFDPATKATVYDVTKYKLDPWNPLIATRYGAWELEEGLVRVKDTIAALPQVGWRWILKGNLQSTRKCSGVHIFQTKNFAIEDVQIYHTGGMGIIGERSENIIINNINVLPTPESDRMVSTTADATHFVGCKGYVRITNSNFENMLDDAANIHGIYGKVIDFPAENKIGMQLVHEEQIGFFFAEKGDSVAFIDNQTMLPVSTHRVEDVEFVNEEYVVLAFKEPIKDLIQQGFGIENITWYPEFFMANCSVKRNRARSILLSSRKKMVVENNYFSSMMAGICIGGDANFWFESGGVTDLVIRNNTFDNCCTSGQNQSAITFEPIVKDLEGQNSKFHKNVVIEENTFKTFDRCVLTIKSVDRLTFRDNKIIQNQDFPPFYPQKGTVEITAGSNIIIQRNEYDADDIPFVFYDQFSASLNTDQAFFKPEKNLQDEIEVLE